jgi:hypothetical protein
MSEKTFEILGVKAAQAGATFLAKVSFAFRPSEFEPVKVTRDFESDGKWKTATVAEIDGARTVRVRSAFLRRSKKGELYVQGMSIDVSWDLNRSIADAAFARLEQGASGTD